MDTTHEDPGAERLLQHASWIRSLARSLIADATTAEDLVQDTWAAALKHRPSAERSLRPWLATVLRNFARKSFRRPVAQDLPEGLATQASGPGELCEQLEAEQSLTAELSRLEEPFRSTLLLRFYRGLEPMEIARQQGTPDGTVRWRIRRGLALLRGRLDQRNGGHRRAWCLALLPLARAQELAARGAAGTSITLPGILAMNTSLKLGGAAAAILVTATVLTVLDVLPSPRSWFGPGEEPLKVAFRPLPRSDAALGAGPERVVAVEPASAVPLVVVAAIAEPEELPLLTTTGVVEALVVDEYGDALAGVFLREVDQDGPQTLAAGDALGRVRLDLNVGEEGRAIHVEIFRSGFASRSESLNLGPGQTVDLGRVALAPGGTVAGRVVDRAGQPVAGALVSTGPVELEFELEWLRVDRTWRSHGSSLSIPREATAEDGSFRLAGLEDGYLRVWAEGTGRMPTCTPPVEVREGEETYGVEVVLVPVNNANRVAGIVLDPLGRPVSSARLEYEIRSTSPGITMIGDRKAGEDGRFEFIVMSGARLTLTARHPQEQYGPAHAQDVPAGEQDLMLRLIAGRQRGLRVLAAQGEPVERFSFDVLAATGDEDGEGVLQTGGSHDGAGGAVRFRVPQQDYLVRVTAPLHQVATVGPYSPGAADQAIEVRLAAVPGLPGVVISGDEPVPGAKVLLHRTVRGMRISRSGFPCSVDPRVLDEVTTDEQGRFVLTVREAGEFVARAEARDHAPAEAGPVAIGTQLQADPVVLRLGQGGMIQGRVISPGGADPTGTVVGINHGDGRPQTGRVGADGAFRFTGLVPGPWRVELRDEDIWQRNTHIVQGVGVREERIDFNCQVREGQTITFNLRLVDEDAYRLEGSLTLDGRMPIGWQAYLCPPDTEDFFDPDDRWNMASLAPDGSFDLGVPEQGHYKLCIKLVATGDERIFVDENVQLQGEMTSWQQEFTTGTLVIEGVDPALAEAEMPPFVYFWEGGSGLALVAMSVPDTNGICRLDGLPVGAGKLVRPDLELLMDPRSWDVVDRMEIRAGEETRIGAP